MPTIRQSRIQPGTGLVDFDAADALGTPGDIPIDITVTPTPPITQGVASLAAPSVRALVNTDSGAPHSATGVMPGPAATATATTAASQVILGHPVMIYRIPQIVRVTYPASTNFRGFFMENYPLNRTDFRMVRGVQNEINFYVRDVDRKPVRLGLTETLTITITDPATDILLMSRNLTTIDARQGIYLLTVLAAEMNTWPTVPVQWSITYTRADGSTVLLWTDRDYSPYSTCTITKGALAGPAPTVVIVWNQFRLLSDTNYYSPALAGSATNGYVGGVQSFFVSMTGFTGSLRIDASLVARPVDDNVSADWFQVDLKSYTNNTGNVFLNETGNYLWMRVVIINYVTGTVDQVQYKR